MYGWYNSNKSLNFKDPIVGDFPNSYYKTTILYTSLDDFMIADRLIIFELERGIFVLLLDMAMMPNRKFHIIIFKTQPSEQLFDKDTFKYLFGLGKCFRHRREEKFCQSILQKFSLCTIRFFRQSSNPVKQQS